MIFEKNNMNTIFTLEEYNKEIRFAHITFPENIQSIKENGLMIGDGTSILGGGIYVADIDDVNSVNALINLAPDFVGGNSEECLSEELSLILGTSNSRYIKCLASSNEAFEYTVGFIALQEANKIKCNEYITDTAENIIKLLEKIVS